MKTKEEQKKYHAEWRKANKDKWAAYGKKWYDKNKDRKRDVGYKWEENNREKRLAYVQKYKQENKLRIAEAQRARLLDYKKRVVAAYGGCCKCCGEKEITFLTVEHCKRNGNAHRKVSGNFYLHLVRNNFPQEDLCILCMNCNWAERNGWPCPHKAKEASA